MAASSSLRVAPDWVISVVDPQAATGYKSSAHGFDGYKGNVAIDPDSEVVTAKEVGPANAGDAALAAALHRPGPGHGHLPGPPAGADHSRPHGDDVARFGRACRVCPLQGSYTSSTAGRTITIHPQVARLQGARSRQARPKRADYRAHRPTVERKLAHLLRRRHGGRRAHVRDRLRVAQDCRLLAAAVNLARFAALGVRSRPGGWVAVAA
jgi:hypothetical protein